MSLGRGVTPKSLLTYKSPLSFVAIGRYESPAAIAYGQLWAVPMAGVGP